MPQDKDTTVGHMSFDKLMAVTLAFHGRLDQLWQRVLYAHAGIVGVMVFFATTDHAFAVPRLLVLFFYTLNTAITIFAFTESFSGLRATTEDLKRFPDTGETSSLQAWAVSRNYDRHARRRIYALIGVWGVVAYLLIYPVLMGILR